MNNFGIHKLYNFGKRLKQRYTKWIALELSDEWDSFVERNEITDDQIHIIRQGFDGKKIEARTDGIFPFGVHKGKPMDKVPMQYLVWCYEQEWLNKWPVVWEYCKKREKEIKKYQEEYKKGLEELKNLDL